MNTVNIKTNKGNLARLLAEENITILHRSDAKTASFDLKTRTIYLPVWEVMEGDLYDLLVGHEVGHAWFTPQEGWYAELKKKKSIKGCLNVIEDARIEKLIKRKYPGLRRPFATAYRDLYVRDFFGISELKNLDRLNLIDKINIHFKLGSNLIVNFNEKERTFVDRVSALETWKEVVQLSYDVYNYMKEEEEDKINSERDILEELLKQIESGELEEMILSDEEGTDGESSGEDGESSGEDGESSGEDGEDGKSSGEEGTDGESSGEDGEDGKSSGEDGEDGEDGKSSGEDGEDGECEVSDEGNGSTGAGDENSSDATGTEEEEEEEDPASVTDEAFQQNSKSLAVTNVQVSTSELPEPYLENIIIPNKFVVGAFEEVLTSYVKGSKYKLQAQDEPNKLFMKKNKGYINLLVKEFEMRKDATQYARTTVSKTGELDMSKIHQYKYCNDLFKKVSTIGKGKSHALIMFLDMSGTMSQQFGPTVEQCLILATFCKKVGIPFSLYGFSDRKEHLHKYVDMGHTKTAIHSGKFSRSARTTYPMKKSQESGFHLKYLIGSDLSAPAYKRAHNMMSIIAYCWNSTYPNFRPDWVRSCLSLGGTPLLETIISSREIINQFNSTHKVDLVNVIYLTDGDGTSSLDIPSGKLGRKTIWSVENNAYEVESAKVIFTDRKTRKTFVAGSPGQLQNKLFDFMGELTGCKTIGFYLTPARGTHSVIRKFTKTITERECCTHEMQKHGFCSVMNSDVNGYDKFYIVKTIGGVEDTEFRVTENMTLAKIKNSFIKANKNRIKNKYLITNLATELATSL